MIVAVLMPYLPGRRWERRAAAIASVMAQGPRTILLAEPDTHREGIPVMLNRLVPRALQMGADYWHCMGDDDLLPDGAIDTLLDHAQPDDDLIHGIIQGMHPDGTLEPLRPMRPYDRADVLAGEPVLPSAALHHRRLWDLVGPYDPQLVHGREDWAWFLRAVTLHPALRVRQVPHVTYLHLTHGDSLTGTMKHHPIEFLAGLKRARRGWRPDAG